jgi:hypothetical protein
MIPFVPLFIVGGTLLITVALIAHAIQLSSSARAKRRRRRQDALEAVRAAQEAARQAAQQQAVALQAETDQRRMRHPGHYLGVQRGRLAVEQGQITERLRHRNTELAALKAELAASTPDVPPARQLLKGVGLVFLVLTFALSAAQLIPSFRTLAGVPSDLDVALGLIVASIEVGVALLLAHYLRPEHGWQSLSAKISAAIALTFALVVVAAQVQWAPAHDTVPLHTELAAAHETYTQDRQNHTSPTMITADQQLIASLNDRLNRVTERDQVLALIVTLGADISAWPAIDALQYLFAAIRRRRLRPRVATLSREVGALEEEYTMVPVRLTYETQQTLERLNINPDLVFAGGSPPPPAPAFLAAPAAPSSAPAPPAPPPRTPPPPPAPAAPTPFAPASAAAAPGHPAHAPEVAADASAAAPAPVTVADLFPPPPPDVIDDRRWTDPL